MHPYPFEDIPEIVAISNDDLKLIELKIILSKLDAHIVEIQNYRDVQKSPFHRRVALVIVKVTIAEFDEITRELQSHLNTQNIPLIAIVPDSLSESEELNLYRLGAADVLKEPLAEDIIIRKSQVFVELYKQRANGDKLVKKLGLMFKEQRLLEDNLQDTIKRLQAEVDKHKATERARDMLEKQLRHAQKLETIGTLAGGIAHDFNNLLGAILGFSEITLNSTPESDKRYGALEQIYAASLRGADLVKQILTFSRQGEYDLEATVVSNVVQECIRLLRSTLPSNIMLRESIALDGGFVMAQPTLIHQIAMNLCTNAAQALENTGGLIRIQLDHVTIDENSIAASTNLKAGEYFLLKIEDNGPGMNEQTLERIFEPFFTTKDVDKGTGLGLSVVHGIVMDLGGDIIVDSELDKGTSFSVYLPKLETQEQQPYIPDNTKEIIGSECILLVDDDASLRRMMESMLSIMGYTVLSAVDGQKALEIFRSDPQIVNLIVTDYAMPEMNGIELSKAIRGIKADVPIVLISGYNESIPLDKYRDLNHCHFTQKPFTMRAIGEAIRESLDKPSLTQTPFPYKVQRVETVIPATSSNVLGVDKN